MSYNVSSSHFLVNLLSRIVFNIIVLAQVILWFYFHHCNTAHMFSLNSSCTTAFIVWTSAQPNCRILFYDLYSIIVALKQNSWVATFRCSNISYNVVVCKWNFRELESCIQSVYELMKGTTCDRIYRSAEI